MEKFSWMVIQMNKKTLKLILISAIILLGTFVICILINSLKKEKEYVHLKKYMANEYIPTYISHNDMAKIYLNDYLFNMRYDEKNAYDLLDGEYREAKFGSFEKFSNYISNLRMKQIKMKKYSKYSKGKYIIYKVYDEEDNLFIFKTNGVMQYKVYFDDSTVEIGD